MKRVSLSDHIIFQGSIPSRIVHYGLISPNTSRFIRSVTIAYGEFCTPLPVRALRRVDFNHLCLSSFPWRTHRGVFYHVAISCQKIPADPTERTVTVIHPKTLSNQRFTILPIIFLSLHIKRMSATSMGPSIPLNTCE